MTGVVVTADRYPGVSRATGVILDTPFMGLIGFDVETARRFVRPELLRLLKRGKTTTANEQYALAAA